MDNISKALSGIQLSEAPTRLLRAQGVPRVGGAEGRGGRAIRGGAAATGDGEAEAGRG